MRRVAFVLGSFCACAGAADGTPPPVAPATPPASASAAPTTGARAVALSYDAPSTCPDVDGYASHVRARSHTLSFQPLDAPTANSVDVRIEADPERSGWHGRVVIPGTPTLEREVHGERCEDVVAALALITVLRLEGRATGSGETAAGASAGGAAGATAGAAGATAGAAGATAGAGANAGAAESNATGAARSTPSGAPEPSRERRASAASPPPAPSAAESEGSPRPSAPPELPSPELPPAELPSAELPPRSPSDEAAPPSSEPAAQPATSAPSDRRANPARDRPSGAGGARASDADRARSDDESAAPIARGPDGEREPSAAPAPDAEAAAPELGDDGAEREPERSSEPWRWPTVRAAVAAELGYATVPENAPFGLVEGELRFGDGSSSWATALSFAYARSTSEVRAELAATDVGAELGITLLTAELALCPPFIGASVLVRACAGVRAGGVHVVITPDDASLGVGDRWRPWLALAPSLQVGVPLSEHWAVRGVFELALQLVRDRFGVSPRTSGDPEQAPLLIPLYRPEAVSLEFSLGIGYTF